MSSELSISIERFALLISFDKYSIIFIQISILTYFSNKLNQMHVADLVAESVLDQFSRLQNRRKSIHTENSWTVLAGVVLHHECFGYRTVSLATGIKCVPASKLEPTGKLINDSHAEVLCRRNFKRYLLNEMLEALNGNSDVLICNGSSGFRLKDGISIHFYTSQSPCGDASMTSLHLDTLDKLDALQEIYGPDRMNSNRLQTEIGFVMDAFKSGDVLRGRQDFGSLGRLRTKPARADAEITASMSCSDKIAKWVALGFGGSLLELLMPRVYLNSIVIGDMFDKTSLQSSLVGRVRLAHGQIPNIFCTKKAFEMSHRNAGQNASPCSKSISYCFQEPLEIVVQGRRQGAARSKDGQWPNKSNSLVCKYELGKLSLKIMSHLRLKIPDSISYHDLKTSSVQYQMDKMNMYKTELKGWIQNPEIFEDFKLSDVEKNPTAIQ